MSLIPGAKASFECTSSCGAVLVTKQSAARFDARSRRAFSNCLLQHREEWLAFTTQVLLRDIALRDLIVVTGCDLTEEWATAVFQENSTRVDFEVQSPIASNEVTPWCKWTTTVEVSHRSGPSGERNFSEHGKPSLPDNYSRLPKAQNQCIFIRGYRLVPRPSVVPKKINASAYSKNSDMDDQAPPSSSFTMDISGDVEIASLSPQDREAVCCLLNHATSTDVTLVI